VLTKFGSELWAEILVELKLDGDDDLLHMEQYYEDEATLALVGAAAKVLGVGFDEVLMVYGEYFVDVLHMGGHLRMMRTMGENIQDFLGNVNHLHYGLERRFKEADFPRFSVSTNEDPDTFSISYLSSRGAALAALVEGVLSRAAARLHHQRIDMFRLSEPLEGYLVSWRVRATSIPPERRLPVPDCGEKALAAGGLWHSILSSLACGGSSRGSKRSAVRKSSGRLLWRQRRDLDRLEARVRSHPCPAELLMKAVSAKHVAAEWDDIDSLDKASGFWETKVGVLADYELSRPASKAHRFVTHSWSPPANWEDIMGKECSYADIKAMELYMVAKDIAEQELDKNSSWEDVAFWVDKCCIPQQHPLTRRCITLIEEFIRRSDGMVVLFSWDYFDRLWCVYEWAAFLVHQSAEQVEMCVEFFLRPSTRALYLHSIKTFSVRNAKCFHEPDRVLLKDKIYQYYISEAAFERFAKYTVIAVLSRIAVHRSGRSAREMEEELRPLRALAEELQLPALKEALLKPNPILWRRRALRARTWGRTLSEKSDSAEKAGMGRTDSLSNLASSLNWQMGYRASIDAWFKTEVLPVLAMVKAECVRSDITRDQFIKVLI